MPSSDAVAAACLAAYGSSSSDAPLENLHALMTRFRICNAAGMAIKDSSDRAEVRQCREKGRLRAIILQLNMGLADTGEILFKEPLPPSPRWSDRVLSQYAARGFENVPTKTLGGLGWASRQSIAGPLQLTQASQRCGPHGQPEALRHRELPIFSYGQMVEEARGFLDDDDSDLSDEEDGDETAAQKVDWRVHEERGKRRWPPAVFQSTSNSIEALKITKLIQKVMDELDVKEKILRGVPAIYSSAVKFVLSAQDLSAINRDAYAALGIGALNGKRADVEAARVRVQLSAAIAYALGENDLGTAFQDLASGPLLSCCTRPWT